MTDLRGQIIEDYRLDASLGVGAVGETYRAVNLRTTGVAAIKVVHGQLMSDGGAGDRFRRQLATVLTVAGPHVLPVRSYGQHQRHYFIRSDFLAGGSLRGLLQQRARDLPLWRALEVARQMADGLAVLHTQRLWHGAIKPENVIVERGLMEGAHAPGALVIRLGDAGLQPLAESGATVAGNATFGSPAYLSPEQCRGVPIDARSDIYSCGVVLYEMVTGFLPFQIKTLGDAVDKHLNATPPSPRAVAPGLHEGVDTLVLRCLAKRPEDRFGSAAELMLAIQAAAQQVGVPVVPAVVMRDDQPRVRLEDERPSAIRPGGGPHVVWRDESGGGGTSRGGGLEVPPGPGQMRVVFRDQGESAAQSLQTPALADSPPAIDMRPPPAVDEMTSAAVGPLNVRRRPTTPERRPSVLPPDFADRAPAGSGSAQRSRRITVAVEPEVLTLTPGMPAIVRVTLANAGHLVDHFAVSVEGVPSEWVETPHKPSQLIPGSRATVPIKVLVPKQCGNHAGDYEVVVRARSRDKPEESTTVAGRWTVAAFAGSTLALAPQRVQGWRRARLRAVVANDGNAPAEYDLSASDEEQKLRCTFTPLSLSLDPCERTTVAVRASVPIRWIGTRQIRAFTVRVQRHALPGRPVVAEPAVAAQGQFIHRPIIPMWVPPVLALLAACILFLVRTRSALHLAVTPPAAQVAIGSTVPLAASVQDARNEVVPNHPVTWRSHDTTVASVNDSGVVTGRREGQTEIAVASGRTLTSIPITVVAARVEAITLIPKAISLKIGGVTVVRATTKDGRGGVLNRDVMWTSSDPTVVTVGGNGRVTAKTAGTATITAMADNKTATADVTVAALAAGETPAGTEDCVGYDPAALRIVDEKASGWGVSDGSRDIATLDNQTDARRAMGLARAYKRHCYLGRANVRPDRSDYIIEYWDGASGLPTALDIEDCQRYDRNNLRIQEVAGQGWMLTDGKLRLTMADTQADAKHAWDIALGNDQFCFIGRGNRRPNHWDYVVQYWKH